MNTDNTIISEAIEVLRNSDRVRIVADGGGTTSTLSSNQRTPAGVSGSHYRITNKTI